MLIILVAALVATHERSPRFKSPLFTLIVLITLITTLTLGGATIALNLNSPTAGPVHWGADYQIWACGNQLDLRDPSGLVGNRIGSTTLYEQNDNHVHYDGTPHVLPDDASLGAFMQAVGGAMSDVSLVVPITSPNGFSAATTPEQVQPYITTNSLGTAAVFVNGQKCGTDHAEVQTFVYTYNAGSKTYAQTKLAHPAAYELSHSNTSPPGDCVIVEFAPPTDRTDHLCPSYGVRDYDRCTEFGVAADKIASCDIREVR